MSSSSSPSSSDPGFRPLLKWPGGKTRELKTLEGRWPAVVDRYLEPFVGGGAVYFSLAPGEAAIADAHPQLVRIYQAVARGDRALHSALRRLAGLWDTRLGHVVRETAPLARWYRGEGRGKEGEAPGAMVAAFRRKALDVLRKEKGEGLDPDALATTITKVLRKRLRSMYRLEQKHETEFDAALVADQVETGVRSGFYTWMRDEFRPRGRAGELAAFYFIREFCYGSMFRFNKEGRFNIPYGGIAYNKKRMAPKVADLFAPARTRMMAGHDIACEDFRDFFGRWVPRLGPRDLVFLDPPYDSDFSEYGGRSFGEEEHRALAAIVGRLPCQVALIIKATPLVEEVYEAARRDRPAKLPELAIEPYDKTYSYNVRGRNERKVTHLLVHTLGEQRRLFGPGA